MRGERDQREGGGRARSWPAVGRPELLAIAGVTALAVVLRAIPLGDGLYGDELITVDDTRSDLVGVFDGLERNEINPPLFYLLAWGAKHLGDAVSLLRVPSLVLGTATVPVLWALGRRLGGPRVGLLAAGLVTLSPFAIFYATEARAYASVMFFVTLSSFALLRAVESERGWSWWVVYGVATLCAIYTHYTSIYVVLGLAVWAAVVHRERVRRLAVVLALVALAYLPWVPSLLDQRENDLFVAIVGLGFKLTPASVFESLARLLAGYPFVPLAAVPGRVWLVTLAAVAASLAAVAVSRRFRALDAHAGRGEVVFVAILALATPLGLLAYTLVSSDLYVPRNLTVALPGLALAVAWLVGSLREALRQIAALLVLVPTGLATVRGLDPDRRRPDSPAIASYIERTADPRDPVATGLGDVGALPLYLDREILTEDDTSVWARARRGRTVFLVRGEIGVLRVMPRFAGPRGAYELVGLEDFAGLRKPAVGRFRGPVEARLTDDAGRKAIELSSGRQITVVPGAVRGSVEAVTSGEAAVTVTGWGLAEDRHGAADAVFVFAGDRALVMAAPFVIRPDIGRIYGERLSGSGFEVEVPKPRAGRPAAPARLRVFAAVGDRASELSRHR